MADIGGILNETGWFGDTSADVRQRQVDLAHDTANDAYGFAAAQAETNYQYTLLNQYIDDMNEKTSINFKLQSDMKGWMDREAMRQYGLRQERRAYEKSTEVYAEQLQFNQIAQDIAFRDTARAYDDTLTSLGFQDIDLLLKYHEGGETAAYETQGLTQKVEQADETAKLQVRGTALNKEIAQAEAALDKLGLRQGLAETRAKAAFQMQDLRREYLQKEGAQRNLGQAGRSAGKAIQALLASHGATQAAIVDSITRADAAESLNFRKIAQGLENTAKQTNLRYEEIAKTLSHTVDQAEQAQKGIGLKFSQLGTRVEFGRAQVQASKDSAALQYTADQQKIHMDKYQADLGAWGNLKLRPEATPVEGLPLLQPMSQNQLVPKPERGPKPRRGDTSSANSQVANILGAVAEVAIGGTTYSNGEWGWSL
tara:strand:+ start:4397 stop:5674 length:1278 start_codon:yes stop_codon:yes gene_type:complete